VDPGERESASIVTGIMKQVVAEVTVWGEVQYGIRTVLDESGVLAEASPEQRAAAEAQTLGVIMTTLNEMRRTPAIAVITEDLAGVKVEGGIELFLAFMFAGFTVMFIFLTVNWSSSSLLREREAGTLRRLLASPLPAGAVIAGKMLAFMLLACMQVVVMFAVARILFKVPLGQAPFALVVLTLVVAFAATALGMLVAALTRSANQAANIGLLLGFLMAGIGGCLPVFGKTPLVRAEGVMGMLAKLTPQGYAVDAYYSLMAEKGTFVQILPQLGIVLLFGTVCFLIARWRFRFQ
jgi:ABC-type multidrug transport system permease subunit